MKQGQRVVLVTGGMGGLGETISHQDGRRRLQGGRDLFAGQHDARRMGRADGVAAATRSWRCPATWRTTIRARKAVAEVTQKLGAGRRAGQQRRHHARHDLQEDGQGQLGRGAAHQPRQPVQHDQAGGRRHGRARLGPHHQRLVGQRLARAPSARPTTRPPRPACTASPRRWRWKWRKKGVTVNTISPGYIGTKMVMAIPEGDARQPRSCRRSRSGRLGKPEEVAGPDHLPGVGRGGVRDRAPTSPSTAASTCNEPAHVLARGVPRRAAATDADMPALVQ